MNALLVDRIIDQRRQLDRIIRDRTSETWTASNMTLPQLRSLFYINRHGQVNLSGLAAGIKVTPANVTGIVDRLVTHKMITRVADPNDRRVLWLNLTKKARLLIDEMRGGRAGEMRNILENLTGAELTMVSDSYGLLIKAAESSSQPTSDVVKTRTPKDNSNGNNRATSGIPPASGLPKLIVAADPVLIRTRVHEKGKNDGSIY